VVFCRFVRFDLVHFSSPFLSFRGSSAGAQVVKGARCAVPSVECGAELSIDHVYEWAARCPPSKTGRVCAGVAL
jgi:hypothetical protein